MFKKTIVIASLVLIDGVFSFIVLFLFAVGFATMPKTDYDRDISDPMLIYSATKQHLKESSPSFIIIMLIGLFIIFISNYFLLRVISKRPFFVTMIIGIVYSAVFISLYFYLCHGFIERNLLKC